MHFFASECTAIFVLCGAWEKQGEVGQDLLVCAQNVSSRAAKHVHSF